MVRDTLRSLITEILKVISKDERYGSVHTKYQVSLKDDRFVHFTSEKRAKEILADGYLKMNPPYEKMGTDTVDAVSIRWGTLVPGVQISHVQSAAKSGKEGAVVGIVFKTDVLPKYGFPEEVKWNRDVKLINPSVVSFQKAQNLIKNARYAFSDDEDVIVTYKN